MRQLAGTMRIAGAAERTSHGLWKEPSTSREGQSSLLTFGEVLYCLPRTIAAARDSVFEIRGFMPTGTRRIVSCLPATFYHGTSWRE